MLIFLVPEYSEAKFFSINELMKFTYLNLIIECHHLRVIDLIIYYYKNVIPINRDFIIVPVC